MILERLAVYARCNDPDGVLGIQHSIIRVGEGIPARLAFIRGIADDLPVDFYLHPPDIVCFRVIDRVGDGDGEPVHIRIICNSDIRRRMGHHREYQETQDHCRDQNGEHSRTQAALGL